MATISIVVQSIFFLRISSVYPLFILYCAKQIRFHYTEYLISLKYVFFCIIYTEKFVPDSESSEDALVSRRCVFFFLCEKFDECLSNRYTRTVFSVDNIVFVEYTVNQTFVQFDLSCLYSHEKKKTIKKRQNNLRQAHCQNASCHAICLNNAREQILQNCKDFNKKYLIYTWIRKKFQKHQFTWNPNTRILQEYQYGRERKK